jgi:hypothetical protein
MCIHGSHVQIQIPIHWNLIGHKHDLPTACVIAKQSSSAVRRVSPLFPEREFGRDLNVFQFLSAFAKLRKANCVCPSACNISASSGQTFRESDILILFENLSRKFKID